MRVRTAAAVIAWKLTALALLPVALCCQAAMAADGAVPACCQAGHDGAACPLAGAADRHAGHDRPALVGCDTLDDALIAMLSLTGFTPETADDGIPSVEIERLAAVPAAPASIDAVPPIPPPRV